MSQREEGGPAGGGSMCLYEEEMARNVLNQEEGLLVSPSHGGEEERGVGAGLFSGGYAHLSTWETDSSDILNCRRADSPVTLLPVTVGECWQWDYFKLPTGIEQGFFAFALSLRLAISWPVFVWSRTGAA